MIKAYYYHLIAGYISVYARPGDKILFMEPRNRVMLKPFSPQDVLVFTENPEPFTGYTTITDIRDAAQWKPDYIVLDGNLQRAKDIIKYLESVHRVCDPSTRIILTYYSMLWKPIAGLATMLGLRDRVPCENWTTSEDMLNFSRLTNFERIKCQTRILLPLKIPFLSHLLNRWISPLPFLNSLCLLNMDILRPVFLNRDPINPSVSIVIPMRNEAGNIHAAFERIPVMGPADELIFIEGNSTDNTWEELKACHAKYSRTDRRAIKIAQQEGKGKKDAVYKGFSMAKNDILMILDGDLTVPPEDLATFYNAIADHKGEFINGCRLVYSLEDESMRFLNMIGNKLFAMAFSYVLGQNLKDTLCGTKVFTRNTFEKIRVHQTFFGDFDPFGDFDLIFGADRMGLKILEVPVRYQARTYGDTNISRFSHGWLLIKMLVFSCRKLKFI